MTDVPPLLLAPEGLAELARIARAATLYAFDFDGTLAPIGPSRQNVRIERAVSTLLHELARRAPVAIVTGRRVEDVRRRLGFVPVAIVGNHGAEDPARPRATTRWTRALSSLRQCLRGHAAALEAARIAVEDKGPSIALHYRAAPDPAAALALVDRVLEPAGADLRRFEGKCVVNLVAADAPDKADAVSRLLDARGCGTAFYAGDDVNDEPVFASARPDWVTAKVGLERGTRARFLVAEQRDIREVVLRLLDAVGSGKPPPRQSSASGV
ncbi:MAG TPA: trehalose-phosphatase [Burkholderiaceae bacterium]